MAAARDTRDAKGRAIVNLVQIPEDERVAAVVAVRDADDLEEDDPRSLLFVSRSGLVKRTGLAAFRNLRSNGMRATAVSDDDALLRVLLVEDLDQHVMLFSKRGKCIRFLLSDVPDYGRTARGNLGMKLVGDDVVVDAVLAPGGVAIDDEDAPEDELLEAEAALEAAEEEDGLQSQAEALAEPWETTLLTVTENGFGTRTPFEAYRVQGRNGKGIISFRTGTKTGDVVGAVEVRPDDQLMLVTDTGRVIRFLAGTVRVTASRNVQGVRLMRLAEDERVVDVERLEETDEDEVDEVLGGGDEDAFEGPTDASSEPGDDDA